MTADTIIIGAGPAAAAAARALTGGGRAVLMLDAGAVPITAPPIMKDAYPRWRQQEAAQWKDLIGEDFVALRSRNASPKFSVPRFARAFGASGVTTDNFDLAAIEGLGGLSVAWGAGLACFNARDMRDWPFGPEQLVAHYQAEAKIVGAAGLVDDALTDEMGAALQVCAPPAAPRQAQALLDRAQRRSLPAGLLVGRARNAVLTAPMEGRPACSNRFACIFGCSEGAIYNAADDIAQQVRSSNLVVRRDFRVRHIERDGEGWAIVGVGANGAAQRVEAKQIFLCAGAIQSAAIVLRTLRAERTNLRLHSTPAAAFAIANLGALGAAPEQEGNSLSAIGIVINNEERDESYYAGLFPTIGILRSHLIKRLPISRRSARLLARATAPAMLLGNIFFPSTYSNHTIQLGDDGMLTVKGAVSPELDSAIGHGARQLRSLFAKLGWIMASGLQLSAPGADAHYAGTLPHRRNPGRFETDPFGQLAELPGVFVADGAVLPALPAKSHTLTIMANARRIAMESLRSPVTR